MTPPAADNDAGRPAPSRHYFKELAMLADGSLPAARRDEAEARIAATPGGNALLANERRAVDALRTLALVQAPASLRDRIEADRARAGGAPRGRRPGTRTVAGPWTLRMGGTLVGAVAALALVLAFVLPGGTPGSPSVSQAASLALRGATSLAPPTETDNPAKLSRNVDEVYFPNWRGIGWTATGERVDWVEGRMARTVYYDARAGWRVAYTIVGGPALTQPRGAAVTSRRGEQYRSIVIGGRRVVTWRRLGHTCILSAAQVPNRILVGLAAGERSV